MYQRVTLIAVMFAFGIAGPASAATLLDAVPVRYAKEKKGKWKAAGCKYKYKADRKGYKEEYKCK